MKIRINMIKARSTTNPPITPPTIAPTDEFESEEFEDVGVVVEVEVEVVVDVVVEMVEVGVGVGVEMVSEYRNCRHTRSGHHSYQGTRSDQHLSPNLRRSRHSYSYSYSPNY